MCDLCCSPQVSSGTREKKNIYVWFYRKQELPSVPALKLPVPVVPAAAVVSGGAGPGALQSREPLLLTDPRRRLHGWGSPAGEMGRQTPRTEMTVK